MGVRFQDLAVGDALHVGGVAAIVLQDKSGRRARVRIETDAPIVIVKAHECRSENSGVNTYGSDYRRAE